jgi:toxin HigB-1
MIVSFKNRATEDIFDGLDSKAARKLCPPNLWSIARRKLDQINAIASLDELTIPPDNRLESLKGDRKGQYSIRINQQYRICFTWIQERAIDVEIVDYH